MRIRITKPVDGKSQVAVLGDRRQHRKVGKARGVHKGNIRDVVGQLLQDIGYDESLGAGRQ